MTRPFTVTFARGFGTGGKAIASRLAKELGIHCYENRILTLASQLSGLDHELFVEVDEKIVTHEMAFARDVASRIIFMDQGYVAEDTDPESFFTAPATERAREFLSRYREGQA